MRYLLSFLFLVTLSLVCFAAIYMQTDKNGTTIFSDVPLNSTAEVISVPEVNKVITKVTQVTTDNSQYGSEDTSKIKNKPYTTFSFNTPHDQETLQNQPMINVTMNVDPKLQPGDMIQIYLDGKPWGGPAADTTISFSKPDRGQHTLSAELIDANQKVLRTAGPITVYIHYAHIPTSPVNNSNGPM